MDEVGLKETLTRESEKSYSPSFNHEISGWLDDFHKPRLVIQTKKTQKQRMQGSYKRPVSLLNSPIQQISKPLHVFQFFSVKPNKVQYRTKTKNFMKSCFRPKTSEGSKSRPRTSGDSNSRPRSSKTSDFNKRTKEKSPKKGYTSILMNGIVTLNKLSLCNRNFSPLKSKGSGIFRRSSSAIDERKKMRNEGLMIHGSSCEFKL